MLRGRRLAVAEVDDRGRAAVPGASGAAGVIVAPSIAK
jgi:hypothetical protein